MAIIDFFDRGWRINPRGVAYIQDEREFTFEEVGELSCRIANGLIAEGFGREAKGAVWAGNDVTAWGCTLGLWRAGMCWIPVGARNPAAENQFILDAFDCEVLFFQKEFAPVVAGLRASLRKVKAWICIDGESPEVPEARPLKGWIADQPPTARSSTSPWRIRGPVRHRRHDWCAEGRDEYPSQPAAFCAHFMIGCPYAADGSVVDLAAAPMTHTAGPALPGLHRPRRHRGGPAQGGPRRCSWTRFGGIG